MTSDEDFKKIYFLIDKLVKEARIEGTIQHINALDTIDELQKEFNRALFVKGEVWKRNNVAHAGSGENAQRKRGGDGSAGHP